METCQYKFSNGKTCPEQALSHSPSCILHIDFPQDEKSEDFNKLKKLKQERVREKAAREDFNFEGARLIFVDFSKMKIKGDLNFNDAVIKEDGMFRETEIIGYVRFERAALGGSIHFEKSKIVEDALFENARIGKYVRFGESDIGDSIYFTGARIGESAHFEGAKIMEYAWFEEAKIGHQAWFKGAEIGGDVCFERAGVGKDACFDDAKVGDIVRFERAEIEKDVCFRNARIGSAYFKGARIGEDAYFNETVIERDINFDGAKIGFGAHFEGTEIGGKVSFNLIEMKEELNFKKTRFKSLNSQERACRRARRICEDRGNRIDSDYYFYHEMEAKRKQKNWFLRILELPIQYVFGYGTRWESVFIVWFLVIFGFGFIYWLGRGVKGANSLWENLYYSISTATGLGSGHYEPFYGFFQGLAAFESIFGTFMWAAFIAIFARKYMR